MKTLVILCGSFPPTNIVGALRPFRLTKELLRQGWKVIVLTNPPEQGWGLDKALLDELQGDFQIHYVSKAREKRFWSKGLAARITGTLRDIFRHWLKPDTDVFRVPQFYKAFKDLAHSTEIDVVLTTSPPHSVHIAGLWIKINYQKQWIVDYRDPWEHYPTTGHLRLDNPIERYFEKKIAAKADALVSTTATYTANLIARHPSVPRERFHTLTNTYDKHKTSKSVSKVEGKFIICYTGIFYPEKDPYGFFRSLKAWFAEMSPVEAERYRSRFEVHLIGSRNRPTREVIEELGLGDCVIFFDRMSHDKAIEKSLAADMLLISSGLGAKTRPGWLPSKLFEYLGCRIPIFALIREGEMAEIIRSTQSGYVVTSEDHALIGSILRTEMNRKLGYPDQTEPKHFLFSGIESFEEKSVMRTFVEVIQNATLPHESQG